MTLVASADHRAAAPTPLLTRRDGTDGVSVVTLNAPASRNALSLEMLNQLSAVIADIATDRSVRALVLAHEGPAFSAGHDLKEIIAHRADADKGRAFYAQVLGTCNRLMQAINALPQPVIAAVEGVATAAGCQLVASCDLAIAGSAAHFCTPGVDIGLFCSTPMVPLSRTIARKHALEMLLTGEMIDAENAFRFGLVNRVVARGQALTQAIELARRIASKSTMTVSTGKRAFYTQIDMGLAEAYQTAGKIMLDNLLADDAIEGIGAFAAKRPPEWTDQ